ncbi:MAG: hypothetical protein CM15mP23_01420 [Cryomorphaceae bacterium]|nr:MAG: hypothetical protein CM15mP23_01420 [Cryomorphaceae bacterium]
MEIFMQKLVDVKENSDRAVGERILGVDPKTGLSLWLG